MSEKRFRSPQEKKELSYERDRRNVYGENAKASRKNIPRSKAKAQRALRRSAKQALHGALPEAEEARLLAESRTADTLAKGPRWKKSPDAALGRWLETQERRRAMRSGRKPEAARTPETGAELAFKAARREARARFVAELERDERALREAAARLCHEEDLGVKAARRRFEAVLERLPVSEARERRLAYFEREKARRAQAQQRAAAMVAAGGKALEERIEAFKRSRQEELKAFEAKLGRSLR